MRCFSFFGGGIRSGKRKFLGRGILGMGCIDKQESVCECACVSVETQIHHQKDACIYI